MDENRCAFLGQLAEDMKEDHRIFDEGFFLGKLAVFRRSGDLDLLPLLWPERLGFVPSAGDRLFVRGELRSYCRLFEGKRRLLLRVFVQSAERDQGAGFLCASGESLPENRVSLTGRLLRKPVYRHTPLGRQITDLFVGVEGKYRSLMRIPAILWGESARAAAELSEGTSLYLEGRLQSRQYEKLLLDGSRQQRECCELSASKFSIVYH